MATIEINLEVYNNLLERIKELEVENVSLKRDIKKKDIIIEDLEEDLDIVEEANFFDRVFKWGQILELIERTNSSETESEQKDEI